MVSIVTCKYSCPNLESFSIFMVKYYELDNTILPINNRKYHHLNYVSGILNSVHRLFLGDTNNFE